MKVSKQVAIARNDQVSDNWLLVLAWWKEIAVTTLVLAVLVFVVATFVMTHYYQATVVIRPVSKADQGSSMTGLLSSVTSSVGALEGLSSDEEKDAEKYMSILTSYAFTTEIIKRSGMRQRLLEHSRGYRWFGWVPSDYGLYKAMSNRFDCDYSLKTGNLTLNFLDSDSTRADIIVQEYVDLLRDKLREKEIENASDAIASLEKESSHISDPQLQAALDGIISDQLQRRAMALVEADFSFEVIDPPVSDDSPHKPTVALDCLLALLLTPLMWVSFLIGRERLLAVLGRPGSLESNAAVPFSSKDDETVSFPPRAESRR